MRLPLLLWSWSMVRVLWGCRSEIRLCYLAGVAQVSEEQVWAMPGIQEPWLLLLTHSGNFSTLHIYSLRSSHRFMEVGLGKEMQVLQTTRCLDGPCSSTGTDVSPGRGTSHERRRCEKQHPLSQASGCFEIFSFPP